MSMSNPEKLTGEQRDEALSELQLMLQGEFPKDTSSEAVFAAKLADPSFPEEHWQVYHRLIETVVLDSNPFEKNLLSPTPGDPAAVIIQGGVSYEDGALDYMKAKLDQATTRRTKTFNEQGARVPLVQPDTYATIFNEIKIQHTNEITKNNAAFGRLLEKFRNDPNSIDISEADLIERIRGVSATSLDRLELLTTHPEIDAIEDAKITCPLDYTTYIDAKAKYIDRLLNDISGSDHYVALLIGDTDQKPRPRKLDKSISSAVVATKTVIAEVFDTNSGLVFEVVEKLNQYAFPADQELPGVLPRLVDAEKFQELPVDDFVVGTRTHTRVDAKNLQPVYMQICLRVKRDRTGEKEGQITEAKYDADRLHIIRNGVKKYIEDLDK